MTQVPPQNRLIVDDEDAAPEPVASTAPQTTQGTTQVVAPPATKARKRRRPEGKGAYPDKRQVTAYVDRQLFLWLKSISAQTDKPMVELFEEALTQYVNTFAAQKKFTS